MEIVLDTNVLVSALLSPHGHSAQLLQQVLIGRVGACVDARILAEYGEVLHRPKFGFNPDKIRAILLFFETDARRCDAFPLKKHLPDLDDEPFLEVAVASGSDYLVTGNLRHYPVACREGVTVLDPAQWTRVRLR